MYNNNNNNNQIQINSAKKSANNNNFNNNNNNQCFNQQQSSPPIIFNTNQDKCIDVENDNQKMDQSNATLLREGPKLSFPTSLQSKSFNQPIINKTKLNKIKIEFGTLLDSDDDYEQVSNDVLMSSTTTTHKSYKNSNNSYNNNNNNNNNNSYDKNKKYNKQSKQPSHSSSFNKNAPAKKDDNNFRRNDKPSFKQKMDISPTLKSSSSASGRNPSEWSVTEVTTWLESIGLKESIPNFKENDINGQALFAIDPSYYGDLNISKIGPKAIFEKELKKLRDSTTSTSSSSSSFNNNYSNNKSTQVKRDLTVDYKPFTDTKGMDIYLKNQLEKLDSKQDIVSTLKSPMNQAKLSDILSRVNLEDSTINFIIKLYSHELVISSLLEDEVNKLYLMLMESKFLGHFSNLPSFIKKDQVKTKLLLQKQLATVFVQLSEKFTRGVNSIPLDVFTDTVNLSTFSKNEHIQSCLTRLNQKKILLNEMRATTTNNNLPPHLASNQMDIEGSTTFKYQTLPIIPLSSEIHSPKLPDLQAIKLGKYSSLQEYIDVQFCLLREDMIHPMREALNDTYSDNPKQNRYLYRNVSFKSLSCTYAALCFSISFTPNRRLCWEKYSRLLKGSLVGFFNNDFNNVIWGVIESRPIKGTEPKIVVSIQNEIDDDMIQYLFSHKFDMIESPAYFESYKNVLQSLKGIKDSLPFQRYLLNCETETQPPGYIRRNPIVDFATTFQDVEPTTVHNVTVTFPTHLDEFDKYQMEALQHCMRSEISLVQGLPGGGKSFIGRKLFELIYNHTNQSLEEKKPPILLVCYTNHALDQFLMGILGVTKNVIRIGSRSKEKELEQYNIRNRIKRDTFQFQRFKQRDHLTFEIRKVLNEIIQPLNENDINEIASYDHKETLHYQSGSHRDWFKSIREIVVEENKRQFTKVPSTSDKNEKRKIHTDWDVSSTSEEDDDSDQEDEEVVDQLIKERGDMFADGDDQDSNKLDIENIDISYQMWVMNQPSNDFRDQDNINSLNFEERKLLYRHWQQTKISKHLARLNELKDNYTRLSKEILQHEDKSCADALSKADVVAATTTGASRLKKVLEAIKSKVVIIEEAAEVLESQVIAILPPSTEHLIMIGDHQQLKPTNSVYQLAKKYKLDLSLFERIVKNGMSYKTLYTQRRMVPNISQNILTIYPQMVNHDSVIQREKKLGNSIRGMPSNIHFFHHENEESTNDHTSSKTNEFEADYVVGLADYLVKQNYDASDIAILTPYTGQLLRIREKKKNLGNPALNNLTIRTVDQFQGEEKDIIILSLVRSNKEKQSGFLSILNRINVSLSRARNALYMIGNATLLESANDIWSTIFENLKDNPLKQQQFGKHLQLRCENHHDQITIIKSGSDFKKVPEGGCLLRCDYRLECSHQCPKACHFDDPNHSHVKCNQTCEKVHQSCGHRCTNYCHINDCPPCSVLVDRILHCGHKVKIACSIPVNSYVCQEPCTKNRKDCGHPCKDVCGRSCLEKKCKEEVTREFPCGHTHKKPCYDKSVHCKIKCKTILDGCGHSCSKPCCDHVDGKHPICTKTCDRVLICGHACYPSHKCNEKCKPCSKKCNNKCPHSKCSRQCFAECIKCSEKCILAPCEHQNGCTKKCHEECDVKPCNKRCTKLLKCRHQCIGLCGMKCPTLCRICDKDYKEPVTLMTLSEFDETDTFIQLDCNHTFYTESLDTHMETSTGNGATALKRCPECNQIIYSNIIRYKDILNKQWAKIERIKEHLRNYISKEEINEVVGALGFAAGHWFECEQGHPYSIGECGGAMQVSKCNECGAPIGGSNHALLPTNRHSTIDGSTQPHFRQDLVPREFRGVQFH